MIHGRRSFGSRPNGRFLIVVLALFVFTTALNAAHLPTIAETGFEIQTHGRFFYLAGDLSGMFEYTGRFEGAARDFRYQGFTLGGYYRPHSNLKIGAFYRLQTNVRHDNDWIKEGSAWIWEDASGRFEHLGIVDVTPRFQLGFLPGENWVASVKARYEYNFSNAEQSLLLRPGLTFFWLRDRAPVLNISAQYATYLSLNFGDKLWYRHGPYLNVLYHVGERLLVDVGISKHWIYWSESEQFSTDHPGESYSGNVYSPWSLDIGLILRL